MPRVATHHTDEDRDGQIELNEDRLTGSAEDAALRAEDAEADTKITPAMQAVLDDLSAEQREMFEQLSEDEREDFLTALRGRTER